MSQVRRVPVNGRTWKHPQEVLPLRKNAIAGQSFNKRLALRKQAQILKTIQLEAKTEADAEKQRIKEEKERRRKAKEENEKRAEIVVKVSAAKAKRMKRKQLRAIRKSAN